MKHNIMYGLLAVMFFTLSGCATLPSPEAMKADISGYELPKMPEAGKAIVYVVRPSFVGTLIKFGVFVDDKEVSSEMGYTKGVQYIYFNLLPGEHQILSKAENWASINVIAKAGDILFIQQEPKMGVLIARNELRVPQEY
ncbi:DUF2846 domain-containing protein [bacterium]|nr:DUF2846 domain-containing protein [bacterium]MBU1753469.1 DUF2846 domain-containing protein [bacterium]